MGNGALRLESSREKLVICVLNRVLLRRSRQSPGELAHRDPMCLLQGKGQSECSTFGE